MFARDVALPKKREYVSPDGSLVLPAYRVFKQGPNDHLGWRFSDTLDTHGLVSAGANGRVVFTNGSENRTFSGVIGQGGGITDLKRVANRGGESAAVDGRAMCMSPTARYSSTRQTARKLAASTCLSVRCSWYSAVPTARRCSS
jgi:hypothetical protein